MQKNFARIIFEYPIAPAWRSRYCVCALVLSAACSSTSGSGTHPDAGAGATSSTGGGTSSGGQGAGGQGGAATIPGLPDGAPSRCADDAGALPAGAICVLDIEGHAIDQNGAPVPTMQLVSACGPENCNPGFTDATGRFVIDVGFHMVTNTYAAQVHGRPNDASFYYQLPADPSSPNIDLGNLRILPMPASGPALNIDRAGTPAQSVTSGDVTLEVGDDVYVRLDVEAGAAGDLGKEFRALRIPDQFLNEYAPVALGVKALYAMEPFESSFEVGGMPDDEVTVQLSFANTANFAAGAAIEVLALGSYIYPDWLPPAELTHAATAHVSSDGKTIAFDTGEGVKHLTWVGLRAMQ